MSLKQRIVTGVFWSLVGNALSKLLNFFAMVLVARVFGPNDYGIFDLLRSSVVTFGVFAGMGIGLTATKYIATYFRDNKKKTGELLGTIFTTAILTTTLISTIILIFSKEFSAIFLNDSSLETILRVGILLLITNTFFALNNAILAGFEEFKIITKINFYIGIINIPMLFFFANYYGLIGVIIGMVITGFLQVMYGFYEISKINRKEDIKISFENFGDNFKFIWKFAFPTFIATFLVTPAILASKAIIAHIPQGYVEVGIFGAAFAIQSILILFSITLNSALVPILISESKRETQAVKSINLYISWIMGLIIAVPIVLVPEITKVIYGAKFYTPEYILTLKVLMFSFVIYMFKESIRRKMIVNSKMWFSVLDNLFWGTTLIISTYYFSKYGSIGMAIAYFLSYFISALIILPILYKNRMIDKELIFSTYSISIWILNIALAFIAFSNFNIWIRVIFVIIFYTLILYFIYSLKRAIMKGKN